jgi:hypothetical protein
MIPSNYHFIINVSSNYVNDAFTQSNILVSTMTRTPQFMQRVLSPPMHYVNVFFKLQKNINVPLMTKNTLQKIMKIMKKKI